MKQPWISKPWIDTVFILLPPFLSLLVIVLFRPLFQNNSELPVAGWVILVLLVDVAHVYSTLYRTYFDPAALKSQRSLLWTIPFFAFVAGVLLYSLGDLWFWRVLAYVAVYHFVRQQYGFMRVYSRREKLPAVYQTIDTLTIYAATIYPLLYWHLSGPRNFNWFVEDDFLFVKSDAVLAVATLLYWIIVAVFVCKELRLLVTKQSGNVPKLAVVGGTALSWYVGIVALNGDLAFTLLNVVSHGIPYMALVWVHGKKAHQKSIASNRLLRVVFGAYGVLVFVGLIFMFAFLEEGLWDIMVWKEHHSVFGQAFRADLGKAALSFVVPLLAVPQVTHYILDGFIWKIRDDEFKWSSEVKGETMSALVDQQPSG